MTLQHSMEHRHIDTKEFTLAAIDDIIGRGKLLDWAELRDAVRREERVAIAVKTICDHYAAEDSIRYGFWPKYLRHAGYGYLYESQQ